MSDVLTQTVENDLLASVSPAARVPAESRVKSAAAAPLPSASTVSSMDAMIRQLDASEQQVLEMLFGLTGDKPRSAEEICAAMALSPEQVTALHDRALVKLRSMPWCDLDVSGN